MRNAFRGTHECPAQATPDWKSMYESSVRDRAEILKALDHALHNMSRSQQATMTDPTYEEAREILAAFS